MRARTEFLLLKDGVESQKGENAVQGCSFENQKVAIAIDLVQRIAPFWFPTPSLNSINTLLALN